MPELLGLADAAAYLVRRGLVGADEPVEVVELGGGVSNLVLAVRGERSRVVLKQALPQLRVADTWMAKPERALSEAAALRLAGGIAPGSVPAVLDSDPESCTLVIEHAPEGWCSWKELLLQGQGISPAVARRLGELIATWHRESRADPETTSLLDDPEAFEQLRVDPYYRTLMARRPELAAMVAPLVERMTSTRLCLVHGDYSPKNVLLPRGGSAGSGLWVVDWEVVHLGDPAFDLAFMSNHLLLKAIHRPDGSGAYAACGEAFWDAYLGAVGSDLLPEPSYVWAHVGCLMAARVDGKSPAEYLTEPERATARAFAARLLADPPDGANRAWRALEAALGAP